MPRLTPVFSAVASGCLTALCLPRPGLCVLGWFSLVPLFLVWARSKSWRDAAFLGFAECDRHGNINASRFAKRISGCGGFINISQNTHKVVFVGTFSSGGLEVAVEDGALRIVKEGRFMKFVDAVGQITFSGRYAARAGQDVYYVTERCVLELRRNG